MSVECIAEEIGSNYELRINGAHPYYLWNGTTVFKDLSRDDMEKLG